MFVKKEKDNDSFTLSLLINLVPCSCRMHAWKKNTGGHISIKIHFMGAVKSLVNWYNKMEGLTQTLVKEK